ncbi:MAG: hypothetical protein K0M69_15855 [Youngiibacter sp.]|nr:hypothetical protein [Youngiibacter sp.]
MEINVIISAPGLEAALNNLAASLGSRAIPAPTPAYIPVQEQAPATVTQIAAPIATPVAPPPAPVAAAPVTPAPAPVAAAPMAYTQNDMAKACVQLMDLKGPAGQSKLQEIMAGLGVMALTQLSKEMYPSLAAALRAEGVNI